ncbi:MAG TPA: ABC transporter permease subunit [Clostridiaceae bacterium]
MTESTENRIIIKKKKITINILKKQKYLIFMSLPFVIWGFIFSYIPLWGWTMAFQNFKPQRSFSEQEWVGFAQFKVLFSDDTFYQVMRNTFAMSLLSIIFGFFIPIIFALLLNEIKGGTFKKVVQTISYLPHFVSWVIAASIITSMLSTDGGIVNIILMKLGIMHANVNLITQPKAFWGIVTVSDIWKEMGWNAIIYMAAMAGIDQELYEAARVDGGNRFQQMWYVTLPGIRSTIIILLVLSIGSILNAGFEKQMLLGNPLVLDYSQTLDLYVLNYGIGMFRYSYGTAIGMFKSVISIILLFMANSVAKRFGEGRVI